METIKPLSAHTTLPMRARQWQFRAPAGTTALRERLKELPETREEVIVRALSALREGFSLQESAEAAGCSGERTRDLVAVAGATIAQSQKRNGPRIGRVWEHRRAPLLQLQPGTAALREGGWDVVVAEGWAGGGRDIRKAYAQVLLAQEDIVAYTVDRMVSKSRVKKPSDQHYRDCWLVDDMGLFTLEDLACSDMAVRRYSEAESRLEEALTGVVRASWKVISLEPEEVTAAALHHGVQAWWLLPQYANAARAATDAGKGSAAAASWLASWSRRLRELSHRKPERFLPSHLGALSRESMNALISDARK